ncbi:sensor domain-containing diguanylate cyclase [Thermosediminibacter oceani]|uniref:Diguanylate cyclase n=1 Tax=Thermosediminibacter oceani (strain ATCC BAA-1034 / DSM 16646 / JW/IW-1228P) TaxID=555079 RepID=D9S0Y9_THEOJ|nr:sensor domain-containing diguanylate cyclase [Thermosediminibacter oceani]ADL07153.1 diguanylate cyclase [Thermosediminibacter oceani DSM 16646]
MISRARYTNVLGIVGTGLLIIFIALYGFELRQPWWQYLLFLLFMFISEINAIQFNNTYLTMEFGFIYAAIFIFGFIPAAVMKAISTLLSQGYIRYNNGNLRETLDLICFNVGQYMISFFGGAGAYLLLKRTGLTEAFAQAVGIFIYFIINNLLVEIYVTFGTGDNTFRKSLRSLCADLTTYAISVPGGLLMVELYRYFDYYHHSFPHLRFLAVLLGLIPYIVLVYIYKIYMGLITTNRELTALYDVAATMTSTLNTQEVLRIIFDSVKNVAPWDTISLFVYQQDALVPLMYEGFYSDSIKDFRLKPGEGITGSTLVSGRGEIINNYKKDSRFRDDPGLPPNTKSVMSVPMINNNEIIGAITLTSNKKNAYNSKHLKIMSILANQATVAISNARLFDKTSKLAVTDSLTRLYNLRYIYEELERMVNRVKNNGGVFSLIIIDIDHFKSYNDRYGHLVGDSILKKLAEVLKDNVRDNDIVGRYGGEEFVIILPDTPGAEAYAIAERIREVVESTEFAQTDTGKKIFITISAGVASCPDDALTVKELVRKADQALLFGAKQKGRNRVVEFKKMN